MALVATENGPIKAWTGTLDGVEQCIARITAENAYGEEGKVGTIRPTITKDWRIDRQPSSASMWNLQLQRNDVRNMPSTAACAFVPVVLFFGLVGATGREHRGSELTRVIRDALNRSARSRVGVTQAGTMARSMVVTAYEITGDFSSPAPPFQSREKPVG